MLMFSVREGLWNEISRAVKVYLQKMVCDAGGLWHYNSGKVVKANASD